MATYFMPQARRNLKSASDALRRLGWFSFWSQLTLSVVSTFILIFSVSFSATVRCHRRASSIVGAVNSMSISEKARPQGCRLMGRMGAQLLALQHLPAKGVATAGRSIVTSYNCNWHSFSKAKITMVVFGYNRSRAN